MVIDLGYSALISAVFIAFIGIIAPLIIARKSTELSLCFAQINNVCLLILQAIACCSIVYSFVKSDFSLKVIALNSSIYDPLTYKICAFWGSYEGSSLLWSLVTNVYVVGVCALRGRFGIANHIALYTTLLLNIILCCTVLFVCLQANPFAKSMVLDNNGMGLNPLLQDPSMTFHPPILYFGYIGYTIPFAIAMSCLLNNKFGQQEALWLRFWLILSWSLLTFGIVSGSFWAYCEVGWGGWWFWDPVENASLLPWLSSTVAVHSLATYCRNKGLKWSGLFMALSSYVLCVLGVYITRSGLFSSVHSFAYDNRRRNYILGYTIVVGIMSLLLFTLRLWQGKKVNVSATLSRQMLINIGNYLLVIILSIVLCGTILPVFVGDAMVIDANFFNNSITPFVWLLLGLMVIAMWCSWQANNWSDLLRQNATLINVFLLFLVILLYLYGETKLYTVLALSFAFLLIITTVQYLYKLLRMKKLQFSSVGMVIAHLGFALCIFGMGADSGFKSSTVLLLTENNSHSFSNYNFKLRQRHSYKRANHFVRFVDIEISKKDGAVIGTVSPEQRFYKSNNLLSNKTAIMQRFCSHIYLVLGPVIKTDEVVLQVMYHPFVALIWLGGVLIGLGGLLVLLGYRWFVRKQ